MKPLKFLEKLKVAGYVNSWDIKSKTEIHPSHIVKVFEEQDILKLHEEFVSRTEYDKLKNRLKLRETQWKNLRKLTKGFLKPLIPIAEVKSIIDVCTVGETNKGLHKELKARLKK